MEALLDSARYRRFLAEAHPALGIDDARLDGVPSFVAPLDLREPLRPGRLRRWLGLAHRWAPGLVTPPALFLGTPFERYDQTRLLARLPAVPELTARVERAAREAALELVVLTNVQPSALDLGTWRRAGWAALPSFPDTVVDLSAASFEGHLARLPAGDRSGIRRNVRRFERAGHRLERITDATELGEALHACYRTFYEKAVVRWQAHTRAYFEGLPRLGPDVRLTLARSPGGDVIGFAVAFDDAHGVQAGRLGVRGDFHRRDAVYFRLLYRVLEEALVERGGSGRWLSLEPTAYRTKRHLGARDVGLVNLACGVGRTWGFLLRRLEWVGRWLLRHLDDPVALERWY